MRVGRVVCAAPPLFCTPSPAGRHNSSTPAVCFLRQLTPDPKPPSPRGCICSSCDSSSGASSTLGGAPRRLATSAVLKSSQVHTQPSASAQRWFANDLPDYVEGQTVDTDTVEVQEAMRDAVERVTNARHGDHSPTAYNGGSGVAYMLWHCCSLLHPEGIRVTSSWCVRRG